jgi:hypothetical protein
MPLSIEVTFSFVPVPRGSIPATVSFSATTHTGTPAFRWTGTFEGAIYGYDSGIGVFGW